MMVYSLKIGYATKRLSVIALSLLCFTLVTRSQNLVVNGAIKDLNICCEYHIACKPEGWFGVYPSTMDWRRDEQKLYVSVSPFKHMMNAPYSYCIVALYVNLDTTQQYRLQVSIPGNDKAWFCYAFTNGNLVYETNPKKIADQIQRLAFDSILVKGEKQGGIFTPKQSGNFIVFRIRDTDMKNFVGYNQYMKLLSIVSLQKNTMSEQDMQERKAYVYSEDRAHFMDIPCAPGDRTLSPTK